jgi:hypothetical protein
MFLSPNLAASHINRESLLTQEHLFLKGAKSSKSKKEKCNHPNGVFPGMSTETLDAGH